MREGGRRPDEGAGWQVLFRPDWLGNLAGKKPCGDSGFCKQTKLKKGFDARPHPGLLPQEREPPLRDFCFPNNRLANPVAGISKDAETISPSPWGEGRDEGGQSNHYLPRWEKALEGHRTPGRWREWRKCPTDAKRLGLRWQSGAATALSGAREAGFNRRPFVRAKAASRSACRRNC
jgi:hypothetical protein